MFGDAVPTQIPCRFEKELIQTQPEAPHKKNIYYFLPNLGIPTPVNYYHMALKGFHSILKDHFSPHEIFDLPTLDIRRVIISKKDFCTPENPKTSHDLDIQINFIVSNVYTNFVLRSVPMHNLIDSGHFPFPLRPEILSNLRDSMTLPFIFKSLLAELRHLLPMDNLNFVTHNWQHDIFEKLHGARFPQYTGDFPSGFHFYVRYFYQPSHKRIIRGDIFCQPFFKQFFGVQLGEKILVEPAGPFCNYDELFDQNLVTQTQEDIDTYHSWIQEAR